MIDMYEAYKDGEMKQRFTTLERAKEYCINYANTDVELSKPKIYIPMLLKRENAKTLKEIPAEVRYAFYDEERKKYLKEHFFIKKVRVGYTEEEEEEMRQRLHKEMAKRKRQGKKVRI